MTRSELQAIWQAATGLRFAPGSATERGLIAVLDAAADRISDAGQNISSRDYGGAELIAHMVRFTDRK